MQAPTAVDDQGIRDAVTAAMGTLQDMAALTTGDVVITHWCKEADGTPDYTESVQVTVTYTNISLLGDYFSWIDFSNIVGISTMRKEGVTEDSDPPGDGLCAT